MATCPPQSLPVQDGVETERENNKLKIASSGRKNGEPLSRNSSINTLLVSISFQP